MNTFARITRWGTLVAALAVALWAGLPVPARAAATASTTLDDLFGWPAPYALGHRGYGANRGEDAARPLENTLEAFQQAFRDGIRIVELDLQMTADGKVVVFHDEFLPDLTCISALTYDQLLLRQPQVPLFRAVLNSSRHFSNAGAPSGLMLAEIKVPVPLCDGANTSAQAEVSESALVAAVVADIRRARMEAQVMLNSGSPSILRHALQQAPEIKRALTLNVLQMLPPELVAQLVRLPVSLIERTDCGLPWYNVGPIARLPSYFCATSSTCAFQRFVGTALGCAGAAAVSLDKTVLLQAGAGAAGLVAALHGAGLEVIVWTVDTATEWNTVAAAGADGITTNNIVLGLEKQAPLAAATAALGGQSAGAAGMASGTSGDGSGSEPPPATLRSRASADGAIRVEWSLPGDGPARLHVLDVAGRELESREVQSFGSGLHELSLGQGLPNGIYFVRLRHAHGLEKVKATLVR